MKNSVNVGKLLSIKAQRNKSFNQSKDRSRVLHQLHLKLVKEMGKMAVFFFEKVAFLLRIADTAFN